MVDINIKQYKRNPSVISKYLKTSNNIITTSQDLVVMFPSRYIEANLATIDTTTRVIGIYAIVDNKNNYAVCNIPIMQELSPFSIEEVTIENVKYKILNFHKNSVFMPRNKLVINADFIYNLFNDFFVGGRIPWFLSYTDIADMFIESGKYLDNPIGNNLLAFEVLTSIIAREYSNPKIYYRLSKSKDNPKYVGLKNIYYSFNSTGSKLIGSYLRDGITSAILEKETKSSETTNILRK